MDRKRVGMSPGTLVHVGRRFVEAPILRAHRFTADDSSEVPAPVPDLPRPEGARLWLEVTGVHDAAAMAAVGEAYGIRELELEDVMHTTHRPKFEERDDGGFAVLRMLHSQDGVVADEQVSLWWDGDVLVSFQERSGDPLQPVRDRLHRGGRIRTLGTSYLAYAVLDAIVDHLFVVLEGHADALADLEERILEDWNTVPLGDVQAVRRDLMRVRRAVLPLREMTTAMLHAESLEGVRTYVRDLHDHVMQALDVVDQQRDLVAGLRDLWMNAQAAHTNRVMQVLTIMATIFIPLTFLAGIYGMNFEHMPELRHPWAYPALLLVMVLVAAVLLAVFRRAGWIGAAK